MRIGTLYQRTPMPSRLLYTSEMTSIHWINKPFTRIPSSPSTHYVFTINDNQAHRESSYLESEKAMKVKSILPGSGASTQVAVSRAVEDTGGGEGRVMYQIACISDIYITIHNNSKITVMK